MHITYSPEGEAVQEWDFDPGDLRVSDAELVARRFGGDVESYAAWQMNMQASNPKALRVLLWWLLRQTHHTLRFEDTPDFRMKELKLELSVAELEERAEQARATEDPELRDKVLRSVELQMPAALAREAAKGSGKAKSRGSSTDGGTPSPQS